MSEHFPFAWKIGLSIGTTGKSRSLASSQLGVREGTRSEPFWLPPVVGSSRQAPHLHDLGPKVEAVMQRGAFTRNGYSKGAVKQPIWIDT